MKFSIKQHTITSVRYIAYIDRSQVMHSKNILFHSLMINFVLVNTSDPDELLHFAAFHLVFTVCQKTLVAFQTSKD